MTTAKLRLVIEVDANSNWSKDVTMEQIYKQALTETVEKLQNVFREKLMEHRIRIIGTPEVIAVYHAMSEKPK